ncbi:MAG: ribbon-helix-helix protein, CopG family [Thermoproteus sp.]
MTCQKIEEMVKRGEFRSVSEAVRRLVLKGLGQAA